MRSPFRLLLLLLLCSAIVWAPAALACGTGLEPAAAAHGMQHQPEPAAAAAGIHGAQHQLPEQAMSAAHCLDCQLCTAHCLSLGTAMRLQTPPMCAAAALAAIVPVSPAGIVIAPEPKPPRG